jgi:developmental checkpoint coupling sporulation initiation to replication initiation
MWEDSGKGVWRLELLSDEILIDAYLKALQLKLEPEFIRLLAVEIQRRELKPALRRLGA